MLKLTTILRSKIGKLGIKLMSIISSITYLTILDQTMHCESYESCCCDLCKNSRKVSRNLVSLKGTNCANVILNKIVVRASLSHALRTDCTSRINI